MPDLHGWISQKIDATETAAEACPPWPWRFDADEDAVIAADDIQVADVFALSSRQQRAIGIHVVAHDPEAVLRRCAADRKLLEIHGYHGGTYDVFACTGCGSDDMGYLVDHVNDCETLLALAEGYGIAAEELAALERPAPPPRETSGKPFSELLAEAFDQFAAEQLDDRYLGDLTAHKWQGLMPIATALLEPTPIQRAFDILGPDLRGVPLYRPTA